MTPGEWQRVEEVFQTALELAPSERKRYLDRECGDDARLRGEVESLLDSLEASRGQIAAPIHGAAKDLAVKQDAAWIGRRIGPYQITALLGHGGMGSVYKAVRVDDEFFKEVAIKIVRQGMDTGFIRERFVQERQILAQLDHPHITRLLDGGTTVDNLPYLVMEYVEGKPITAVCAERKLSIPQRLRMVLQICAAVQYAHRNLIVHRDLKPGNILVTLDNTPKLLDFGIAKILAADPGHTGPTDVTAIRMMTPEYSSPEQVMGLPVTAATDVYALGAILYELLSTQKAHRLDTNSPLEIERVVVKQDPIPPSVAAQKAGQPVRWQRQLKGDIDNIVLTAMRKEPERRYNSAEQLAQDIQNHLAGLPVMARPNTVRYRAGKFVTRNRLPLGLAALLTLSLVAGMIATAREAGRANRRFHEMRGLARTILFEVHDKLQSLPGSTEARALMITKVGGYLDNLSREAAGDISLHRELAQAYLKIGDVQGSPYTANLGKTNDALDSYRKAVDHWQFVVRAGQLDQEALTGLAGCYYRAGDVKYRLGDRAAALENFRLGLDSVLAVREVKDAGLRLRNIAAGHHRIGDALLERGDLPGAYEQFRQGRAVSEQFLKLEAGPRARFLLATSLVRNGHALAQLGDLDGAEAVYRAAVDTREEIARERPEPAYRRELIPVHHALANVLGGGVDYPNLNRTEEALQHFRRAHDLAEAGWREDPKNAQSRYDLAISHTRLGVILSQPAHLEQALKLFEEMAAADPENISYVRDQVYTLCRKASLLTAAGNVDAAHRVLVKAQELGSRLPRDNESRNSLNALLSEVARYQTVTKNYKAAIDTMRQAIAVHGPVIVSGRQSLSVIDADSQDKELLAKVYESQGEMKEACRAWQASEAIWKEWSQKGIASSYSKRRSEEVSRALQRCPR